MFIKKGDFMPQQIVDEKGKVVSVIPNKIQILNHRSGRYHT
jgi:hypothetical protein